MTKPVLEADNPLAATGVESSGPTGAPDKSAADEAAHKAAEAAAAKAATDAAAKAEADAAKAAADKAAADKAEGSEGEPEAKPEGEAKPDENEEPKEVWADTASDTGNAVVDMLQSAGVTQDEAKSMMYDAIAEGDPSKINLEALEAKLGKSQAFLAKQGVEAFIAERAETVKTAAAAAHEAAGGEENWNKVRDWTASGIEEKKMTELAGMIDAGGEQQKYAFGEIMKAYNADAKNSDLAPTREEPSEANTPPAIAPVSKTEYADKYDSIYNDRSLSPKQRDNKLAALNKARASGRAQGL